MAYSGKYPLFSHLLNKMTDAAPKAYPMACEPRSESVQLVASSAGSATRKINAMQPRMPTIVPRQLKGDCFCFEVLLLCFIVAIF